MIYKYQNLIPCINNRYLIRTIHNIDHNDHFELCLNCLLNFTTKTATEFSTINFLKDLYTDY